jgi:hypothetical protein
MAQCGAAASIVVGGCDDGLSRLISSYYYPILTLFGH